MVFKIWALMSCISFMFSSIFLLFSSSSFCKRLRKYQTYHESCYFSLVCFIFLGLFARLSGLAAWFSSLVIINGGLCVRRGGVTKALLLTDHLELVPEQGFLAFEVSDLLFKDFLLVDLSKHGILLLLALELKIVQVHNELSVFLGLEFDIAADSGLVLSGRHFKLRHHVFHVLKLLV